MGTEPRITQSSQIPRRGLKGIRSERENACHCEEAKTSPFLQHPRFSPQVQRLGKGTVSPGSPLICLNLLPGFHFLKQPQRNTESFVRHRLPWALASQGAAPGNSPGLLALRLFVKDRATHVFLGNSKGSCDFMNPTNVSSEAPPGSGAPGIPVGLRGGLIGTKSRLLLSRRENLTPSSWPLGTLSFRA